MAEPFLGEIRMMSFDFPPNGWAFCNGQFLPINQNQALFSLLGTTFGGDGRVTFALPNLQGRVPIHVGDGFSLGTSAGAETHNLTSQQMPQHTHTMSARQSPATTTTPAATSVVAASRAANTLGPPEEFAALSSQAITSVGADAAHPNMAPFLVINFCIALQGIFPSQN
jgi:microcystin-dependent protein